MGGSDSPFDSLALAQGGRCGCGVAGGIVSEVAIGVGEFGQGGGVQDGEGEEAVGGLAGKSPRTRAR